jgi:cytochrome c oxidase assembly protein subunit 15
MAKPIPQPEPVAPYSRGRFLAALALVGSVFPLIWMGGLVTSHGVGLSVPDWPNSYGYNMFLFPPSKWLGGIFYEHTHRLLGTLSGFLSILLVMMAWGPARTRPRQIGWGVAALILWLMTVAAAGFAYMAAHYSKLKPETVHLLPHFAVGFGSLALIASMAWRCRRREERRWVRWLTVGVLIAVCIQGTLGGLRVEQVSLTLAIIHGCFAQFFFCLAGFTTLILSRWWLTTEDRRRSPDAHTGWTAVALIALTTIVIYGQLIAGALMRHNGAGLAIPGVLVYGQWVPPMDAAGLDAINAQRAWGDPLHPLPALSSLTPVWLHFAHRVGAALVTVCILTWASYVFGRLATKNRNVPDGTRAAGRIAAILLGLLLTQVTLGVLTVYLRKPADIASLHVAVGALTLLTASLGTAILARQYGLLPAAAGEPASPLAGRFATV